MDDNASLSSSSDDDNEWHRCEYELLTEIHRYALDRSTIFYYLDAPILKENKRVSKNKNENERAMKGGVDSDRDHDNMNNSSIKPRIVITDDEKNSDLKFKDENGYNDDEKDNGIYGGGRQDSIIGVKIPPSLYYLLSYNPNKSYLCLCWCLCLLWW